MSDEIEITELVKFEVERIDGVASPANGFPVLMMKGLGEPEPFVKADGSHAPMTGTHGHSHPAFGGPDGDGDGDHEHGHSHDGDADHHHSHAAKAEFDREAAKALVKAIVGRKVDESPDIAGGTAVLAQIADLIIAEAQELKAGQAGEICDIQQLACAAEMIWCWRTGEESVASGSVMPATALMQSVKGAVDWTPEQWSAWQAELEKSLSGAMGATVTAVFTKADMSTSSINDLPDSAFAYIEDGGTKDSEGKTTPRSKRHFPVHDAAHVRNALSRAPQSPFGEKAMPKIKAAAKREGIEVSDDTAKGQIAKGDATVDTGAQGTGDLSEVVKATDAKAAALEKRVAEQDSVIKALEGRLAKVEATPVPGGPVLSRNVQVKQPGAVVREDWAAKAAYYREQAQIWDSQDRGTAEGYRLKARDADEKAVTATS